MPPPKVDTRSKTRRQKEKNRRRKKTLKNRKRVTFTPGQGQSFTDRFKRYLNFNHLNQVNQMLEEVRLK